MGPTRMNRSMPLKFGTCSRIVQQIIKKLKLFGKYMKTSNRKFLLIIQWVPQICYHLKRINSKFLFVYFNKLILALTCLSRIMGAKYHKKNIIKNFRTSLVSHYNNDR